MKVIAATVVATSLFSTPAFAEYVATGSIEGSECKGFGIEACSFVSVDAVEGDDGQLFTLQDRYQEVTEYDPDKGRCWVATKTKGVGVLGWAMDAFAGPRFFTESVDGFEPVDVDYITFPCRRE